jgi:hypothetical protein
MIKNYFKHHPQSLENKGTVLLTYLDWPLVLHVPGSVFMGRDELTFDNANVKKDRLYQLNVNMTFDE